MSTSPVFNEVIGVSFDTQSFTESVEAIKDIWQKALDEMGGQSPTVGVANTDAVTAALTKTAEEIKSLGASYSEAVDAITGKLTESVTGQAAKVESSTKSVSAAAKKAATDVVNEFAEMANQSEEALARFHDAAGKFLKGGNQPSSLTTNAQSKLYNSLQGSGEGEETNALGVQFDQLTAKQKEWYTNFAQVMAQAEDRLVEFGRTSVAAEQEEQLSAALAAFQRYTESMVSLSQEANAEMLADFRASMEARVEAGGLTDEELNGLTQQELETYIEVLSQRQAEQEKAEAARIASLNKEADAEERAYEQGLAAFRKYVNEKMGAEAEDLASVGKFTAEQTEIYQQAAMKYAAIWRAAYAENSKRDGANNQGEDDDAMQRRMQKQVALEEQATREMLGEFRKRVAGGIAAGQLQVEATSSFTKEELEIYDQEARKFAATWEQAYAEKARKEKDYAKQNPQPEEKKSFVQAFSSSLSDNLSAESLGSLAGIQLAWTGIGAAIGLASKAVSEVVDLFKSGFEYAAQLEQKAALLQGVIASNVKLSQDFQENFRLAGEASVQLQKNFEDASIKYGISVEVLERGFKQLVDGGGVSLVRNLSEAQQVSVLFGVSLQAAGKDADTTRAILSELPKLLSGTEKPSSLILETLGLTAQQWTKITTQAKIHHDLLDQLSPLMQNYMGVAEQAAQRQIPLTESISLLIKRIMADGESSPFREWTSTLQEIKQYLEDNRAQLTAIVGSIVQGVVSLGQMVAALSKMLATMSSVGSVFHTVWVTILAMVEGVTTLSNAVTTLSNILSRFSQIRFGDNFKNDVKSATEYAKQQIQDLNDKFDESAKRLYAADTGHAYVKPNQNNFQSFMAGQNVYVPGGSQNGLDTTPGPGSKTPTDLSKQKTNNDPLHDLQKQYADQSALSKQQFDQDVEQNKLLFAERKISQKELDDANSKAAQAEYLRQVRIIDLIREQASELKGVKPESIKGFNESLDTKQTNFGTQEKQRISEDNIRSVTTDLQQKDKLDEEAIASIKRRTADYIAELKKREQAGQTSNATVLASTQMAIGMEKVAVDQLYQDEIIRAGADATRVAALNAQKAQYDVDYTKKADELSQQRVSDAVKEFDAKQESVLKQAKLQEDKVEDAAKSSRRSGNVATAAQQNVVAAQAQLKYADAVVKAKLAELDFAVAIGETDEVLSKKAEALQNAQEQQNKAKGSVGEAQQAQIDKSPIGSASLNLGGSIADTFNDFKDSSKDFATDFAGSVENLGEAINVFHTAANNIYSAFKNGGVLGGVGASASAAGGLASSLSKSVGDTLGPMFAAGGPILSAVGTVFSAISSIFTQEAQDIANDIEKALTNANNAYSDQTATLVQTLAAVQQQRSDAISELSGIKGGQAQLDKLLPQIDQEIAQLQLQIKEAMVTFTNSLQDVQLNNTALSGVFDKWQQINTQVQAYLSAGGSVAAANQYISQSLEAMKTAAGDALNQGYQQAISDAENLNNLIQQRMQMEQQEAQTEFATVNGDALERRGTKAITEGTQLQQEKAQYQQQLDNLNSTIDLTQQKVNLEGQIFNIAMSTTQLQETSNALQIQQLQEQLTILQAQKDIYNGISQGANGQYTMSQTLMNEIGVVNIIVQTGGTAGDDSAASPNDVANAVNGVMQNWSRYGMGNSISKT